MSNPDLNNSIINDDELNSVVGGIGASKAKNIKLGQILLVENDASKIVAEAECVGHVDIPKNPFLVARIPVRITKILAECNYQVGNTYSMDTTALRFPSKV